MKHSEGVIMAKQNVALLLQNEALPPLPTDILDAQVEIRRLQKQLIAQNRKMASMWEKRELDKKSLMGQIKKLKETVGKLESQIPSECSCYCHGCIDVSGCDFCLC